MSDMDGTLVDSTPCIEGLWRRWTVRHHSGPDTALQQGHGRHGIETIALVTPLPDVAAEAAVLPEEKIRTLDGAVAIEGAAAFLNQLTPDQRAVVTSAPRQRALAKLAYANLPALKPVISADDISQSKPYPEAFLKGGTRLGLAPQGCLAFEDALSGVASAQAAGMPVIALTSSRPAGVPGHADQIIYNYHSLQRTPGKRLRISGAVCKH